MLKYNASRDRMISKGHECNQCLCTQARCLTRTEKTGIIIVLLLVAIHNAMELSAVTYKLLTWAVPAVLKMVTILLSHLWYPAFIVAHLFFGFVTDSVLTYLARDFFHWFCGGSMEPGGKHSRVQQDKARQSAEEFLVFCLMIQVAVLSVTECFALGLNMVLPGSWMWSFAAIILLTVMVTVLVAAVAAMLATVWKGCGECWKDLKMTRVIRHVLTSLFEELRSFRIKA